MMPTEASGGADERHEVKFAAYELEYAGLRHWLMMRPENFLSPYPARQVNNVYFDTWDYRAFAENLAGVSERSKVRYRWYGDSQGPAAGSLEVKQKRNHFGWKQRYRVEQQPWHAGDSWNATRAAIRAQLPMNGQLWLDQNPMPVMLNRYLREYFETADGDIRATIDTQQRIFDQRSGAEPNFRRQAITEHTLVVEFKFARAVRQRAVAMLADMPLRIGRHSKYMNAVRAIALV